MTHLIASLRVITLVVSFPCFIASFFFRGSGNTGTVLGACGGLLLIISMVAAIYSPKERHLYTQPAKNWVLVLCGISAFFTILSLVLSQL